MADNKFKVRYGLTVGDGDRATISGASGDIATDGDLSVTGDALVNANLTVNGTATLGNQVADTVTINGNAVINNALTIGSSSGDTVTVNSQVAGEITFNNNSTTTSRGVTGIVGVNDFWRFGGAAAAGDSTGYAEIASGDDGTEPIYVRQYTGSTATRTATLLDASGDTQLPGELTVTGDVIRKSTGTTVISFSGTNLTTLAGDVTIAGNTIRSNGNTPALELLGADVTAQGNLTVTGDLTVNGTTTTINSTTLDVDDKNITIAKGAANAAAADGGGITLEGPTTPATILYEADNDSWNINKATNITGAFTADTASTQSYLYEDAAETQIAATIARTVTTTSTAETTITSTTRKSMKIMVTVDDGTDTHCIEALVIRDAADVNGAQITLYAELRTGAALATFTADYDSGSSFIRLRATPATATSTTFKVIRTALF